MISLRDSPLEEAGFEPSVPRDKPKFSTPAHVTCLTPYTRKSGRKREPILRGCRPPPAEPMVRIRLPPAASLLQTDSAVCAGRVPPIEKLERKFVRRFRVRNTGRYRC